MKAEDLFQHIDLYKSQFLRRKWLIIGLALAVGLLLGTRAFFSPKVYKISAVFHPETSSEGASGLDIPNPISILMGSPEMSSSGQQLIGVLKSRSISEHLVSDSISMDSSQVLLADVIIENTPIPLSPIYWVMKLILPADGPPSLENKVIKASKTLLGFQEISLTEEGFINFSVGFYTPGLSQLVAQKYIENLEAYFYNQKTEQARRNVTFFTSRSDSVKRELDKVAYQRAKAIDQDQYRIFARDNVNNLELEASYELLKEMYIRLIASKEQSIAQLKRDTPMIQVLDPPKPPFKVEGPSALSAFLIGTIFSALFLFVWLCRKQIKADLLFLFIRTIESND